MDFREQVKQELNKLNLEQQRVFMWRIAIRSLPFLGYRGVFNFWDYDTIQEHLYSVFYALDMATIGVRTEVLGDYIDPLEFSNFANEAYNDASTASYQARGSFAAVAAESVAYIVFFYSGFGGLDTADRVVESVDVGKRLGIDFGTIILQDLKSIPKNIKQKISIGDYGEEWNNFQKSLKNEGCGYWATLYQGIFENNFELDEEELERRINVPEEIKKQGAAAVGKYLQKLNEEGAKRLNEARVIILGDKGVGKTCIARKLVNPDAEMTEPEESTAGVDTSIWELNEDNINVRIWDFAGHTVTHAVHQFFLSERCLYIMVYDGRSEKRNRLQYWLDHMKNYGGNSQAIILVNERDRHKVKIPINNLKEQYPIAGLYAFNVEKDIRKLEEFRKVVTGFIRNNPSWKNQEIPQSYYLVKEDLEARFIKQEGKLGEEHIRKNEFVQIAQKYKVEDPEVLLKDLHHLGVSLWYENMEEYDTLVLNPEWISQGVYQIINWVSNQEEYSLTLNCFQKVFKNDFERYPIDKHKFLFDLIKHYELAYETDKGDRLIIPHLLQEDQPQELPVFEIGKSLMIRYEADQALPPNTISRFIVRHNTQIRAGSENQSVWKYGVILEDGMGNLALVREKDRTLSVSVRGKEKTQYISTLRSTLNEIFESYRSKKPELQYKLTEYVDQVQDLWLPEQDIIAHIDEGRLYFDPVSRKDIPVKSTAVQYNITYNLNFQNTQTVIVGKEEPAHKGKTKARAEWKEGIKKLVAEGQTKTAMEEILKRSAAQTQERNNQAILLFGRLSQLENQNISGTLSQEEKKLAWAEINESIINLVDVMEVGE